MQVGLIGCGQMGRGLARNLVLHGHEVIAWDSVPAALQDTVKLGAKPAASLAALVDSAGTLLTCLPDIHAIEAVYLGEHGLLAVCRPGTLIVETSSSRPVLTRQLGALARERGIGLVDAPLIGTAVEAWDGSMAILAAGSDDDIARAMPVLQAVARKVLKAGALGQAHLLKALNNVVAMTNHAILSETFAVAEELGLDLPLVLEVLRSGFGASRKLEDVGPKIISKNHPRRAVMSTAAKDLGIFKEMSIQAPVPTPVLDSAIASYTALCEVGEAAEPPSRMADLLRAHDAALRELLARGGSPLSDKRSRS